MVQLIIHSKERLYSSGRVGGYTNFVMKTNRTPTDEEVAEVQVELGYHPAGYGGPWNIKTERTGEDTYETKWNCSGSCD